MKIKLDTDIKKDEKLQSKLKESDFEETSNSIGEMEAVVTEIS